jgi:hypothetical protein
MSQAQIVFVIRTVHTIMYLVMAASVIFILLSDVVGYSGPVLVVALILIGIEVVVFVASGMQCPLTGLARRYGAGKGYVFDIFLPERLAQYTFRLFGLLLVMGVIGLGLRTMVR